MHLTKEEKDAHVVIEVWNEDTLVRNNQDGFVKTVEGKYPLLAVERLTDVTLAVKIQM